MHHDTQVVNPALSFAKLYKTLNTLSITAQQSRTLTYIYQLILQQTKNKCTCYIPARPQHLLLKHFTSTETHASTFDCLANFHQLA